MYFDDLRITHTKSKILQEDHYYLFGLGIAALSSGAPLSKPNKLKLSGNEEQTEFDLNLYDFNARMYDQTLGRFNSIDPMAVSRLSLTPYNYVSNNPTIRIDPSGLLDENDVSGFTNGSPESQSRRNKPGNKMWFDLPSATFDPDREMFEGIATCPTCPTDEKYDSHRRSAMEFGYDEELGAYLEGIEVNPSLSYFELAVRGISNFWNRPDVRLFTGDALTLSIDLDAFIIGGADIKPIGIILPLRGGDAFRPHLFSDAGVGAGLDISASIQGGKLWYTGNVNDIRIEMFQGYRGEANIAFTYGVDVGLGVSAAQLPNGEYVLGASGSVGFGIPAPFPVTGNVNVGATYIWGINK